MFYFRTDPLVAKTVGVLLKDKARRMAVNFARLPELLAKLGRGESAGGAYRAGFSSPTLPRGMKKIPA